MAELLADHYLAEMEARLKGYTAKIKEQECRFREAASQTQAAETAANKEIEKHTARVTEQKRLLEASLQPLRETISVMESQIGMLKNTMTETLAKQDAVHTAHTLARQREVAALDQAILAKSKNLETIEAYRQKIRDLLAD